MPPVLRKRKISEPSPEKAEIKVVYPNGDQWRSQGGALGACAPKRILKSYEATEGTLLHLESMIQKCVVVHPNQAWSGYATDGDINRLPFDCFHLIFRRIDLRTQILALRTVCHTWHDHIGQYCASKSHLTLNPYFKPLKFNMFIRKNWFFLCDLKQYVKNMESYCNDLEFRFPKITKLTTSSRFNQSSLFSLFGANLTELNLTFDHNSGSININIENVAKLLKSFSAFENPRTFSLYFLLDGSLLFGLPWKDNNRLAQSLYRAIGDCVTCEKLPTVRQLHLNIDLNKKEFDSYPEMHLDPYLLSQLEHFSMDFHTKRVPELMGQLNPRLTFLSFNCDQLPPYHDEMWKEEQLNPVALLGDPQFEPSLTHLRLNKVWNVQLSLFCDRFMALKTVQLGANRDDNSFNEKWFKPLNQLQQLVELRLHEFKIHVFPHNTLLQPESRCLPRVKKLTWYNTWFLTDFSQKFCLKDRFDGELFCCTVAGQFENLEELVMLTGDTDAHAQQVRDQLYHFKNLQTKYLDFNV